MDRKIVWTGAIPQDTDQLDQTLHAYAALGRVIGAVLGTSTLLNGLTCTPTAPASLQVLVNPGEIYTLQNIDATSYGSVGANTTHQIMKQGLLKDAATLACPAPPTPAYSVNYLVQIAFSEADGGDTVLQFYNADDPLVGWSGPGGSGDSSKTVRQDKVAVAVKAGAAAPTGSQTTPAADAGYIGAFVVTVAYGATAINSGAISAVSGAPFLVERLGDKISVATADARYTTPSGVQTQAATFATAAGAANALTAFLTPAPTSLVAGLAVVIKASATNTGATTLNLNGLGVRSIQSGGAALVGGEIVNGLIYEFVYDGSQFEMISQSSKGIAPASTTVAGIVQLATNGVTQTGTDATKAVTPAGLASMAASTTFAGLAALASSSVTQAGTDAAKAVTPAALASFAKSLGGSGYTTIPGANLILQWGRVGPIAIDGSSSITFPITFPNAIYRFLPTGALASSYASGSDSWIVSDNTETTSGASVHCASASNAQQLYADWFAIGS